MKNFFLEEVVNYTIKKYKDYTKLFIIFPNRRAGLYFQKALSKKYKKPILSPNILTIEDFIQKFSDIKIADEVYDAIRLNYLLFKIIGKHQNNKSRISFDDFFYWGKTLIKDFDDVDLSLNDVSKIFKNIRDQKEIEKNFNFLEKENFQKIKSFWLKFFPKMTLNQKNFRETWEILLDVYKEFTEKLIKNKLAYKGLVYKVFLSKIKEANIDLENEYLFVGFSFLSNSEKSIIKYFIQNKRSMVFWDIDKYYFDDTKQEAGNAFRLFYKDQILRPTFPKIIPNNLNKIKKDINLIGVGSQVGQSKVLGNLISKKVNSKNFDENKVLILLPDENLLLPVLNSIPSRIKKINVTMGLNLYDSPLLTLVYSVYNIYKNVKIRDLKNVNYFKDIIHFFSHPYIYQSNPEFYENLIFQIRKSKKVYIDQKSLISDSELFKISFFNIKSLIKSMQNICFYLINNSKEIIDLDKEYLKSLLEILEKISSLKIKFNSIESQYKLIIQILRQIRVPFSGEPFSGLQIMGVLESRNLDFDDVYILSMNEGDFPKKNFNVSFIPYNIRKAFVLDTKDSIDEIYSYLFYRVIQRAKNVTFIYNNNSNILSKGEKSRYIRQLDSESGLKIKNYLISDKLKIQNFITTSIKKDEFILNKLKNRFYNDGYLSPSGVKDFMDCSLKFYYKYVANIKELNEISNEIPKLDFGKITHKVLEILYSDVVQSKKKKYIDSNDFFIIKNSISGTLSNVLKNHFRLSKRNELKMEGSNIIIEEIMKDYISKVISIDEKYAPFEIIDLEGDSSKGYIKKINISEKYSVNISGVIDRVDKKNNTYRIIDYKTGGDIKKVKDLDSIFSLERKDRNNAIFQLLFYSLLLNEKKQNSLPILPGLLNIREMSSKKFKINIEIQKEIIEDVNRYLKEFEILLSNKISEIFDKEKQFIQTEDSEICKYCSYKNLCFK